jgi:hypothetical protein
VNLVGFRFGHIGRKFPLNKEWPAIHVLNFWSACVICHRIAENFLHLMSSISCRCDDFHVWTDAGILHSGTRSWRRSRNWQNTPESACRRRNLAKFWHDISISASLPILVIILQWRIPLRLRVICSSMRLRPLPPTTLPRLQTTHPSRLSRLALSRLGGLNVFGL